MTNPLAKEFTALIDTANICFMWDNERKVVAMYDMGQEAGRCAYALFTSAVAKAGGSVYNRNNDVYDVGTLDQLLQEIL